MSQRNIYGPALPPGLLSRDKEANSIVDKESSGSEGKCPGVYGPALPPGLTPKRIDAGVTSEENKSDFNLASKQLYGPSLPPSLLPSNTPVPRKVYGPSLPSEIQETQFSNDDDDQSDDGVVGPMLPSSDTADASELEARLYRETIEARSSAMKDKLTGKKVDEKLEREEWMLELPPEIGKNFGLGPRTFRAKAVDLGDRSVWTDTPQGKSQKKESAKQPAEPLRPDTSKKEAALRKEVDDYNKSKRPVTLMEIHKDKMKKQKFDGESIERRPFNRDTDLATERADPRAKIKLLSNSQKIADKFHSGQFENKFL